MTSEYYIGKRTDIFLKNSYRGSSKLVKEKIKNGEPFSFLITHLCKSNEDAFAKEKEVIGDLWKTDNLCLNKVPGGKGGFSHISWKGIKKSETHRLKIGQSNKKPRKDKEKVLQAAKLGAEARRGMKDTDEVKSRRSKSLSLALTGKPRVDLMKKFNILGKNFIGLKEASNLLGVSKYIIRNRVKSDEYPDWRIV